MRRDGSGAPNVSRLSTAVEGAAANGNSDRGADGCTFAVQTDTQRPLDESSHRVTMVTINAAKGGPLLCDPRDLSPQPHSVLLTASKETRIKRGEIKNCSDGAARKSVVGKWRFVCCPPPSRDPPPSGPPHE